MDKMKPKNRRGKKLLSWIIVIALASFSLFIYIRYYYVFGEGVKSGELNYMIYKGVIFKTYEGKLIQSGFRADKPGGLQSNQFEFSVQNKEIAQKLMLSSGKFVQLHYKEYFAPIPWRGFTTFIVDSIITIEEPDRTNINDIAPYAIESM